MIKHVEGSPLR